MIHLQCWDYLLISMIVGQGPTALAVSAGGSCLGIFLSSTFFFKTTSSELDDPNGPDIRDV